MNLEEGQASLLEFKKENVKELNQILKSLSFRDYAVIYPFHSGLKITVDDGTCQQASAYLDSSIFSIFVSRDEGIRIKLPIKTLTECLNMTEGTSNSVKMTYSGFYEPLRVLLEESDGLILRAKIHTLVPEQELDFEFQDDSVTATCMLKTQLIKDVFKDFDSSSKTLKIKFTPRGISFITKGDIGNIVVSIPTKSLQMETMKCEDENIEFTYRLSFIQRMNSVFTISEKVVFRVDDRGVLCSQFTIDHGDNKQSYIEFLTVPDEENNR